MRDQEQPWKVERVLETTATLPDRIPRVVHSLYPRTIPRRPDVPA